MKTIKKSFKSKRYSKKKYGGDPTLVNIIRWNARVNVELSPKLYDELTQRGLLHESYNGSYWADVKFTSNKPGFLVQKIEKDIKNLNNVEIFNESKKISTKSAEYKSETTNKTYWEIFYLNGNNGDGGGPLTGKILNNDALQHYSFSPDGFVQKDLGSNSSGYIIQTGTSKFYPYTGSIEWNKSGGVITSMKLNKKIQGIFGKHVTIGTGTNANGLPYSTSEPLMTGLKHEGPILKHVVEYWWNNKPKPRSSRRKTQITQPTLIGKKWSIPETEGETIVKETVSKDRTEYSLNRPKTYKDEANEMHQCCL